MNGPMNGTSIQELTSNQNMNQFDNIGLQHQMGQMQYGAMHNNQHEGGHNSTHHVQQAQHDPYYDIEDNANYPQYNGPMPPLQTQPPMVRKRLPDIEDLARDISDNLPEESISITDSEEEEGFVGDNAIISRIPVLLREPLLIVIIFTILSQPIVRDNISKYIPQLNPVNGKVGLLGIVIYGIILATLFAVVKKFLLK